MGKRILVTGATGFLGSHLCPALEKRGDKVFGLWRTMKERPILSSTMTYTIGDAGDLQLIQRILAEYEIDCVVHLAAQTQVSVGVANPESVIRENIAGTLAVLEAARLQKTKRVVIASTDKVYGTKAGAYHEEMPLDERTPYGASKACADILTQTYINSFKLSAAITRCGNLFGPGHLNFSTLIPGVTKTLILGGRPRLRFGGLAVRDFLYVDDAVKAYMALIDSEVTGPFNFSGGKPRRIIDVAMAIALILNKDKTNFILEEDGAGEIKEQSLDCAKAKAALKWEPSEDFGGQLENTVKWYLGWFNPVRFNYYGQ
jgi:CDP-glucose 4,6-dehydratase